MRFLCTIGSAVLLLSTAAHGQTARLVADINSASVINSSRPRPADRRSNAFASLSGGTYFVATTQKATNIWRTSGTPQTTQLVSDLSAGTYQTPFALTQLAPGRLLFFAVRARFGPVTTVLFASNGTLAGTRIIKTFRPGATDVQVARLGNRLVFRKWNDVWITDGTTAGTVLLKTIMNPVFALNEMASNLTRTRVFFAAGASATGSELWVTDGTAAGTKLVRDIRPGVRGSQPSDFVLVGTKVLFSADDGLNGRELWETDGTAAGTKLVKDVAPGSSPGTDLARATVLSGKLHFLGTTGSHGGELWQTDGTPLGTIMLKDIDPGFGWGFSSASAQSLVAHGKLWFVGSTGGRLSLWTSDGTSVGTTAVRQLPAQSQRPKSLVTAQRGSVAFILPGTTADALWTSDGTGAGTKLSAALPKSSRYLSSLGGGRYVFSGERATGDHELFVTNATTAGTTLLTDLFQGSSTQHALPIDPVALGDITLFGVTEGRGVAGLWRTDGTVKGTTRVKALPELGELTRFQGKVLFRGFDVARGRELWITDGTPAGTRLLKDIDPGRRFTFPLDGWPSGFLPIGDKCYFTGIANASGGHLWVTDGTTAGTKLVKQFAGAGLSARSYTEIPGSNGRFAFVVGNVRLPSIAELWASDGTTAGTIRLLPSRTMTAVDSGFAPIGRALVFGGRTAGHGVELWRTDGTSAGTRLVRDIAAGPTDSTPKSLTSFGTRVVFTAATATHGAEPWITDGTSAGTRLLRDLNPGTASSYPRQYADVGPFVLFAADGSTGTELYRTDGTTTGTGLVSDIYPGPIDSAPAELTRTGYGRALMSALHPTKGRELFVTDGTSRGTQLIDINPHVASWPTHFGRNKSRWFFSALGANTGIELFVVDAGATSVLTTRACGELPRLDATSPQINATQLIESTNVAPRSASAVLLGVPAFVPAHLAGCTLAWDPMQPAVLVDVWAQGMGTTHTTRFPILNDARLVGIEFALQALHLTSHGTGLSNGLECVVGR